jgi:SAM-dependent methyltransferase
MQTSAAHYKTHLGPVYAWMLGDLDAAFERAAAEIEALPLPRRTGLAVDLGAGLGLHSVALAARGFEVIAIDNCPTLLDELLGRCGGLTVTAHNADLLDFPAYLKGLRPEVIVCMGDTLTHLPDLSAAEALLAMVAASLPHQGVFATTFRDYAGRTLHGDERFISVRADEERILACFLEYGEDHVVVHDLLHEKQDGRWRQSISSYPKIRLAPEWVAARLSANGFAVKRDTTASGMTRIVAIKA